MPRCTIDIFSRKQKIWKILRFIINFSISWLVLRRVSSDSASVWKEIVADTIFQVTMILQSTRMTYTIEIWMNNDKKIEFFSFFLFGRQAILCISNENTCFTKEKKKVYDFCRNWITNCENMRAWYKSIQFKVLCFICGSNNLMNEGKYAILLCSWSNLIQIPNFS